MGKEIKSIELLTRDNSEEVWEALGSEHGVGVGIGHLKHNAVQGGALWRNTVVTNTKIL